MANLTGSELVDRLADIGLGNILDSSVTDDPQFSPNHIENPAVPLSITKVLVTSKTNLIQAINGLKIYMDSLENTTNLKINTQFSVLGDFLTHPDKKTRLLEIDEDVLEALHQIDDRLTSVEPSAPEPNFVQMVPPVNNVAVNTTDIIIPLIPLEGEFSLDGTIILMKDVGSVVLDTVSSLVNFNQIKITLGTQPLEVGESYTIIIPRKALVNGATPNKIEYTQAFNIASVASTPVLNTVGASPQGTSVNYLLTDKVEIPITSVNHLNILVINDSLIDILDGGTSKKHSTTPSAIIDDKLVIYVDTPLNSTTVYSVEVDVGALADGTALNTLTTYNFTTEAVSAETTLRKSFSLNYGVRSINENTIEPGLDLSTYMTEGEVYNSEDAYDSDSRKVFVFKKRITSGVLDIKVLKVSNNYNQSADSNDWGSFVDIYVEEGEVTFGHDMIENSYDFELVKFAVNKTEAEALSWAVANFV